MVCIRLPAEGPAIGLAGTAAVAAGAGIGLGAREEEPSAPVVGDSAAPIAAEPAPAPGSKASGPTASVPPVTRTDAGPIPVAAAPPLTRGYVVFVDTTRIVIDLTARDGVKPGSVVSLRRDKIPIVHPMTGELLGELDEEVATGKVTEVRDKFSVVEVQSAADGAQIKIRDRVLLR